MKVHVVIPAGGVGKRFSQDGFTTLKPFIKINGITIFEHIIRRLLKNLSSDIDLYFDIIILKKFKEEYKKEISNLEEKYNLNFNYIDILSKGTTCTALSIFDKLNNDDFTLLMNCDQLVDIDLVEYIKQHKINNAYGSILCFTGEKSKKWSFVIEKNNIVEKVVAKNNVSDTAVCGWYCWEKGSSFIKYAISQIINNDLVNDEFYLCPIFNYAIKDNKKILCIKINSLDFYPLGDPKDFYRYINNWNLEFEK